MYLIYTDETGTDNHPNVIFSMYGGLVVHEYSVLKFEMQIIEIVQQFLGFKNMLEVEVHFTEIFNYIFYKRKPSSPSKLRLFDEKTLPLIKDKTPDNVINFIDELFQLISKAHIPFLFNVVDKRDSFHNSHYLNSAEISHNAYAFKGFLNLADRFLTSNKEMGLLIADDFLNQLPKKLQQLSNIEMLSDLIIRENPHVKEIVYKRVMSESLVWKNKFLNGSISSNTIAPLKYKFESNSFNIIDNINFVSSNDSIINQISDVLLYVLRKIKEYNLDPLKYKDIKSFCTDKNLLSTIRFLYNDKIIMQSIISLDDGEVESVFVSSFE